MESPEFKALLFLLSLGVGGGERGSPCLSLSLGLRTYGVVVAVKTEEASKSVTAWADLGDVMAAKPTSYRGTNTAGLHPHGAS